MNTENVIGKIASYNFITGVGYVRVDGVEHKFTLGQWNRNRNTRSRIPMIAEFVTATFSNGRLTGVSANR